MPVSSTPVWIWVFILVVLLPAAALLAALLAGQVFGRKPGRRLRIGDTQVELWVRERRFPARADAIVVPVAPDLKMVTGIAKWVRDATANRVQYEAERVAPLQPGDAFVGTGGRYRFRVAALAVVMDGQKLMRPEWISAAVSQALVEARRRDARSCLLPDMTEDLLRQPQWITDEQRRETCRPIARAMLEGVAAAGGAMDTVRIWVWRSINADIWGEELERIGREGLAARRRVARISETTLTALQADAATVPCDALLRVTDTDLSFDDGDPWAVHLRERGGPALEEEVRRRDDVEAGGAAMTGAGNLAARHVIHAVVRSEGVPAGEAGLWAALQNGLTAADEERLRSIVVVDPAPSLAGSVGDAATSVAVDAVADYLSRSHSSIREVLFVALDAAGAARLETALAHVVTHGATAPRVAA